MPVNLTESSTFTTPVQVPDAGDPVSAGAGSFLRGALQALTNRTKFLGDILTSTGITKVRTVASVGALKALAGPVSGDVVLLTSGIPQLYIFRSVALAGSDLVGMRYDSTTVAGQWVSPWFFLADTSGSFSPDPRLDVQVLPPPYRTQNILEVVNSSPSTVSWTHSSNWRQLDAQLVNIPLSAGDYVLLNGSCTWSSNDAVDGEVDFRLYVSAPGGAAAIDGTLVENLLPSAADKRQHMNLNGHYRATDTGNHSFFMELRGIGAAPFDFFVYGNRTLRGIVIRPLRNDIAVRCSHALDCQPGHGARDPHAGAFVDGAQLLAVGLVKHALKRGMLRLVGIRVQAQYKVGAPKDNADVLDEPGGGDGFALVQRVAAHLVLAVVVQHIAQFYSNRRLLGLGTGGRAGP